MALNYSSSDTIRQGHNGGTANPTTSTSSNNNRQSEAEYDNRGRNNSRKIPWHFLRHTTIYFYTLAILFQSAGYGLPQTYLNAYAHDITHVSQASATLLLTIFNIPGIMASLTFGYLSDNKHFTLSATTVTTISATCTALSALLFWGLTSEGSMALLVIFSITFGFFGGGYSATWGGIINEMETEAVVRNEAIDTGMVYGLLNGARGIGYVAGGLIGVPLLKIGGGGTVAMHDLSKFGYGSIYGPVIIFTGVCSVLGGGGPFLGVKRIFMFGYRACLNKDTFEGIQFCNPIEKTSAV